MLEYRAGPLSVCMGCAGLVSHSQAPQTLSPHLQRRIPALWPFGRGHLMLDCSCDRACS